MRATAIYGYTDEVETSNSQAESVRLDDYGLLNLRTQYDDPRGRFSVALFGRNVMDEEYDTTGYNALVRSGLIVTSPGRPREWGLDFTVHF